MFAFFFFLDFHITTIETRKGEREKKMKRDKQTYTHKDLLKGDFLIHAQVMCVLLSLKKKKELEFF